MSIQTRGVVVGLAIALSGCGEGVAEALSEHVGSLMLNGLENASATELRHLANHIGPVYLASLPADTPGLAEAFAGFRYPCTVKSASEATPPSGRPREDQP